MQHDQLFERRDGFNCGYRMKCVCGRSSFLSARDYAHEINQAHMDCEHCGADIHFGRAVIAIRDEQDPALDDELVPRLAWYHSSTWPGWPSADFVQHAEAELRKSEKRLRLGLEYALEQLTTHALHLGTYEAAVENMLRRMHDQADGAAQFYLYRVQLQPGLRIEAGYRDENLAEASRLTVPQMEAAGLDVVRYLNAYEAEGTLSLAVQLHAVAAVQRIVIPVTEVVDDTRLDERLDLAYELAADQREADQASARLHHIPIHERKLMNSGSAPIPTTWPGSPTNCSWTSTRSGTPSRTTAPSSTCAASPQWWSGTSSTPSAPGGPPPRTPIRNGSRCASDRWRRSSPNPSARSSCWQRSRGARCSRRLTSPTVSAPRVNVPNVSLTATNQRIAVSEGMALGVVMCDRDALPYDKVGIDLLRGRLAFLAVPHPFPQVNTDLSKGLDGIWAMTRVDERKRSFDLYWQNDGGEWVIHPRGVWSEGEIDAEQAAHWIDGDVPAEGWAQLATAFLERFEPKD